MYIFDTCIFTTRLPKFDEKEYLWEEQLEICAPIIV